MKTVRVYNFNRYLLNQIKSNTSYIICGTVTNKEFKRQYRIRLSNDTKR